MDPFIQEVHQRLTKVLDVIKNDLATIRTGRAAPSFVENVVISAYGGSARLKVMELATVHAQDTQTLVITPFDGSIIGDIKKDLKEEIPPLIQLSTIQIIQFLFHHFLQEERKN